MMCQWRGLNGATVTCLFEKMYGGGQCSGRFEESSWIGEGSCLYQASNFRCMAVTKETFRLLCGRPSYSRMMIFCMISHS